MSMASSSAAAPGWPDEEHDPLLGGLSHHLRVLLFENGWKRAVDLEASFDSVVEAESLIRSLPGNHEPISVCKRWAVELMTWQQSASYFVRRVRSRVAGTRFDERLLSLQSSRRPFVLLKESVLLATVKLMCVPVHWRTRRAAKMAAADGHQERTDIERREKEKWTAKVVAILVDADAPVVQQAKLASSPNLALSAVTGNKRARTIRSRVRVWYKVRLWLQMVLCVPFPLHIGHMLDYLNDLGHESCSKTFPASVSIALSFMEKAAGIPEAVRISKNFLWQQNVEALSSRLHERSGSLEVAKAPNYSVSMLIALELVVMSDRAAYIRVLAWVLLVMVWCSLRYDDMQSMSAARLTWSRFCLRSILGRTKTTGPGRRTGEIPCYCRSDATFAGVEWVETGFGLFKKLSKQSECSNRDYFLPRPAKDFESFVPGLLDYSYCSALTRQLHLSLKVPVRNELGKWQESEGQLISPPAHLFWQQHSPRHFAPSISAVLHAPADQRAFLGRWGINSPKLSNDYVLTSRQVILDLQGLILRGVSCGPSTYDEEDMFEQFRIWLEARSPGADAEQQIENLRCLNERCVLQQAWPPVSEAIILEENEDGFGPHSGTENADSLPADAFLTNTVDDKAPLVEDADFWVSVGRSGFRRLHRLGGCTTDRFSCREWIPLTAEQAQQQKADRACKLCWPGLEEQTREKPVEDSDADSYSSESSSTSESDQDDQAVE